MTTSSPTTAPPLSRDDFRCPSWCRTSLEEHAFESADGRGGCVHWGGQLAGADWNIDHSCWTEPDGTTNAEEPPRVYVDTVADGISVDSAESLAHTLLELVEEARS